MPPLKLEQFGDTDSGASFRLAKGKVIRVGVDARPLRYPRTGIGRYLHQLVDVLSTPKYSDSLQLVLYGADQSCHFGNEHRFSNQLFRAGVSRVSNQLLFPVWAAMDNIDVFWSPRHHLPLACMKPCVVTAHDTISWDFPETMASRGSRSERRLYSLSLRKAKKIIAVSQHTRSRIAEIVPNTDEKIEVIYNASSFDDSTRYDLAETERTPYALFVGTFEPRKNIPSLLRAWRTLLGSTKVPIKLILAGTPGWGPDVPELIKELGISASVETRSPTDEELASLYANCHFVVVPSLNEGFGLPAVEAMGFGKRVAYANCGALPELVGASGESFEPDNIEQIAKTMGSLFSTNISEQTAQDLAQRTRNSFSWQRSADSTAACLIQAACDDA